MVLIFALTVVVFFLLYFGPYRNPGWLSPGFAGSLCLFGIAAFSTGEFIREAVRKPFVVYNVVLGNQILPEEVPSTAQTGYLEGGAWTRAYVADALSADRSSNGRIRWRRAAEAAAARTGSPWARSCSSTTATIATPASGGYSAVGPLLRGRSARIDRG